MVVRGPPLELLFYSIMMVVKGNAAFYWGLPVELRIGIRNLKSFKFAYFVSFFMLAVPKPSSAMNAATAF